MPDLIPFTTRQLGSETVNTVNARDLYDYLGITKPYAHWIKTQLKRAHLIEHTDYVVFALQGINPQGGRPQVDHHLTFDAAKHVAMMSSAEKGHEVRAWFIAKEKELAAMPSTPAVLNPEHQLMIDMIVRIDQNEQRALLAEAAATRAESKADMALNAQEFYTVAEYIYFNGLRRQLPESAYRAASDHLRIYCLDQRIPFRKQPVGGKKWADEYAFHVSTYTTALTPWLSRRDAQSTLHVLPSHARTED